ncbi:unnamed protein product (macronuclear) [Paramecium tetraurelia]|uniref:Uncharacterized protein n=1 Tax=Paramecium tetraurelia TaxID=5888 RepID=A0EAC4_PARTE|nr:uncharacterized protein GSPATT00024973001 [Paramecium tetraurelia]CAK92241.1 unnamed protein product [Paramecium tetraurelia]|eukprot:XP_001459638.1 hypothetical protein (macronuclear) [Paramecium tetraurelia strain d4-2]
MEFENESSQAQSTGYFQNPMFYTPSHNQQVYTVPPNTINHPQQYQNPQNQFWFVGTNLINQQQMVVQKTVFDQPPLQIQTQQFFQQSQELNDDDHDQDYQPEEDQGSDSTSSDEQQEDLQEEGNEIELQFQEQFDDPDFDLQAYLKVRDQL